ncbi:hypothetical protein BASA81_015408 [Batrachochytrium salamandrivorans]|nr:hypothetical protein BASA81_015408 [Batrachochytrium salamandrivorans]
MFAARRVISRRSMSTAQETLIKTSEALSKSTGRDLTGVTNKLVSYKDAFLKEMEDPIMRGVGFLTLGFFAVVHIKRFKDKRAHAAHAHHDAHDDHHHEAPKHTPAAVHAATAPAEHVAAVIAVAVPAVAAPAVVAAQEKQQVKPILHQLSDVANRLSAIEKALGISN